MGAELKNLDGFGNEQPEETQIQQPPEQPGGESGDEGFSFTQVRLEDINRDELTPPMQSVYDDLLVRANNMDADYTQKSQDNAAIRKDAETWRTVQQHPDLLRVMNEAIYRKDKGLPLDDVIPQQSQQPESPDPNTDPIGFMRDVIRTEMKTILGEALPPIQQGLQQVTGDMQQRQALLEFDNLANIYPAAKSIGIDEINRVRNLYRDQFGKPVPMATALAIKAQENPAILNRAQRQPARPQPKNTPVEQPKQKQGSTTPTPIPEGIRKLHDDVKARQKDGTIADLGAAVRRAMDKFR